MGITKRLNCVHIEINKRNAKAIKGHIKMIRLLSGPLVGEKKLSEEQLSAKVIHTLARPIALRGKPRFIGAEQDLVPLTSTERTMKFINMCIKQLTLRVSPLHAKALEEWLFILKILTDTNDVSSHVTRILHTIHECIQRGHSETFKVAVLEIYFKFLKELTGADDLSVILARPILLDGQEKALTPLERYKSVLNYTRVKDMLLYELITVPKAIRKKAKAIREKEAYERSLSEGINNIQAAVAKDPTLVLNPFRFKALVI